MRLVGLCVACLFSAGQARRVQTEVAARLDRAAQETNAPGQDPNAGMSVPPEVIEQMQLLAESVEKIKADTYGGKVIQHATLAARAFLTGADHPKVKEAEKLEKSQEEIISKDKEFKRMFKEMNNLRQFIKKEAGKKKPNEKKLAEKAQKLAQLEKDTHDTPAAKQIVEMFDSALEAMREDEDLKKLQQTISDEMNAMIALDCFERHATLLAAKSTKLKMLPRFADQLIMAKEMLASYLLEDQIQSLKAFSRKESEAAAVNAGDFWSKGQSLVQLDQTNSKPLKSFAARHLLSTESLGLQVAHGDHPHIGSPLRLPSVADILKDLEISHN